MKFDTEQVFKDMLAAISGALKQDAPNARKTIDEFLKRRKRRLETVINFRLQNQISEAEFSSRLQDEKLMLEAEMEAMKAVSKAMAQKAANAAIEVLEKAVRLAVGGLL
ncbi:MAG: hypothetical protein KJ578_13755 [Bacteroidetes bacterium]|nr:hypothetical protein [Bacteroidota bacterium]MBU1580992.1 hypothetical protein [Bacteroidota bacterium]MBU2558837.1 hypothetical protein [Bacteroidota bacterium]